MKIILLGPPGSGKGTVSERLEKVFNLLHVSAGELLREEVSKETTIGKEIKKYIEQGHLVPNQFVVEMIKLDVAEKEDYILDGFPRTVEQAESINDLAIDLVIYLDVPEDIVIERLSLRRMDPETGKIYHLKFIPPPEDIKNRLVQRKDDQEEVIKDRFKVYHQETEPLIEYYSNKKLLKRIDGSLPPEEVYQEVKKLVEEFKK